MPGGYTEPLETSVLKGLNSDGKFYRNLFIKKWLQVINLILKKKKHVCCLFIKQTKIMGGGLFKKKNYVVGGGLEKKKKDVGPPKIKVPSPPPI